MKKNGFTLVELIGTIVILSLALIILVPVVTSSLKEGIEKADKNTKASIESAARNWAIDNMGTVGDSYCVTVSTLQSGGYLDKNLKLPSNGSSIDSAGVQISVKSGTDKKTYTYTYKDNC